MKILITGGHITPALAVIDELRDQKKTPCSIVFVGRKFVNDREMKPSLEYQEIMKRHLPFNDLKSGRITRIISLQLISSLLKFPRGFFQAWRIIKKERPNKVLTFGGYIGFPIGLSAWLKHIPLYLHEQTVSPGITNRILGIFSQKIFVSFPDSVKFFPKEKVIITGNPVRKSIFEEQTKPLIFTKDRPVIYVTGGSLGSHSINALMFSIIPSLIKKYIVIHQTGDVAQYGDYEKALLIKNSLPHEFASRYFVAKHFLSNEIGFVYHVSDLVVGRSGANTFFELIALNKPTIFIPLPWSAAQEQQKHAELFSQHKIGEVFDQNKSSGELEALIDHVIGNKETYRNNFQSLQKLFKENAAQKICAYLLS